LQSIGELQGCKVEVKAYKVRVEAYKVRVKAPEAQLKVANDGSVQVSTASKGMHQGLLTSTGLGVQGNLLWGLGLYQGNGNRG